MQTDRNVSVVDPGGDAPGAPPPLLQPQIFFLRFCVNSHLLLDQTTMYLVSLETSLKMQENGVGLMLEYKIYTHSNLTKSQRAPPPLS